MIFDFFYVDDSQIIQPNAMVICVCFTFQQIFGDLYRIIHTFHTIF